MEWLLVIFTSTQWYSSSFSESGYKSEAACVAAAPAIVSKMNDWELRKQAEKATANSKLYNARQWDWLCAPSGKK